MDKPLAPPPPPPPMIQTPVIIEDTGTENVNHVAADNSQPKIFSKESYGSLAFDLVLKTAPIERICQVYNITLDQLSELLKNPGVVQAIKDAQTRLTELGSEGGFALRSRALAEDLLPDIYRIAKNDKTDAKLRKEIFDMFARYALLDPSSNKKGADSGTRITFNIGGGVRGIGDTIEVEIDGES